jgi:hypothetical protein
MQMKDALEKEISGELVMVAIGVSRYPLSYRMYNVILYKQRTGDSLFDPSTWPRIDLQLDPERWLACLWSGLHQQQNDKAWKSPFTMEELGALVDFSNASEISITMAKAIVQFMPKAKESDPKAEGLAGNGDATSPRTSPSSGLELVTGTDSLATNS